MQLHELQPTHKKATAKRVGRGGKRGKTSGRGHKGQLARAGNSTRPEMRDIIKKLPKLRGYGVNRGKTVYTDRPKPEIINVSILQSNFSAGDTVTPKTLVTKGVVKSRGKKVPNIKILGNGDLTNKLTVQKCQVSSSAKEKIEAAGGTVA